MTDPTRDEMLAHLHSIIDAGDYEEFEVEEAIYWFAHDHHSGQWSNLYAALSGSKFTPGAYSTGLSEEGNALEYYRELEEAFSG